jgi:hypothetical protein
VWVCVRACVLCVRACARARGCGGRGAKRDQACLARRHSWQGMPPWLLTCSCVRAAVAATMLVRACARGRGGVRAGGLTLVGFKQLHICGNAMHLVQRLTVAQQPYLCARGVVWCCGVWCGVWCGACVVGDEVRALVY